MTRRQLGTGLSTAIMQIRLWFDICRMMLYIHTFHLMTNGQVDVLKLFTITRMLTSANGKNSALFTGPLSGEWPVNSPHKGRWRGALMLSLICAWTNGWVNNGDTGDLRRHRAHYDVSVGWSATLLILSSRSDRSLMKVYSDQSYGYLLVSETKLTSSGFLQSHQSQ